LIIALILSDLLARQRQGVVSGSAWETAKLIQQRLATAHTSGYAAQAILG